MGFPTDMPPAPISREVAERIGGTVIDYLREIARLQALNEELAEALSKIASFAPGYGDVCEIIAMTARSALRKTEQ